MPFQQAIKIPKVQAIHDLYLLGVSMCVVIKQVYNEYLNQSLF